MPRKRRNTPDFEDSDNDSDDSRHPQRNAANARERARMRVLSKAFCRLKTTLPWVPADTKLSKLDTLRLATSYIASLREVLNQDGSSMDSHKHPITLTWPFTFQKPLTTECGTISNNTSSINLNVNISSLNRPEREPYFIRTNSNNHHIRDDTASMNIWHNSEDMGSTAGLHPVLRDKDISYYY